MDLNEYLSQLEELLTQAEQGGNLEGAHMQADDILCTIITWLLNSRHDSEEVVQNRQRIRLLLERYREVSLHHFWYA